jgi:hypothetical protein
MVETATQTSDGLREEKANLTLCLFSPNGYVSDHGWLLDWLEQPAVLLALLEG